MIPSLPTKTDLKKVEGISEFDSKFVLIGHRVADVVSDNNFCDGPKKKIQCFGRTTAAVSASMRTVGLVTTKRQMHRN